MKKIELSDYDALVLKDLILREVNKLENQKEKDGLTTYGEDILSTYKSIEEKLVNQIYYNY